MNTLHECTCVLQCTCWGATTLLCSFKKWSKCNAKCLWHTKFTKVHKYTRWFLGEIFGTGILRTLLKVVKSNVFMYISELYGARGLFLPCNPLAIFRKNGLACTLKMGMFTEVHRKSARKGLIHAR